jgi:nucleoside-triphosphatase
MNRIATHPETSGRVLLVTGVPGVGKTTVIRELVRRLAHRRLSGFYTEEMRQHGQRVGFRLATLDGEWTVMAHMDFRGLPQVSKYGVDVAAIDAVATRVLALKPGVDIYLVDEVGKMESLSPGFVRCMRGLLASDKVVIATVAAKGAGLIDEIKRRRDSLLREVTQANRAALPAELVRWVDARFQ